MIARPLASPVVLGAALAVLCLSAPFLPAAATPFTSTDLSSAQSILTGFNAVVNTTYTKGNETEGRIVAGGNLVGTGNGNLCFNGCGGTATVNGTSFGAATIYGGVSGSATFNVMNGSAAVAGNISSNSEFNHNGGLSLGGSNSGTISDATFIRTGAASAGANQNTGTVTTNAARVFAFGGYAGLFSTPLNDLVAEVAQVVSTLGNVAVIGDNTNNFGSTAVAATGGRWSGGYGYGFYTTTEQNLSDAQNFAGINAGNLSAVFVVVSGGGGVTLPTVQNGATRVIWVLPDATSVNTRGQFDGTILAPNATFSNSGGNMNGLVYANAVNQVNEFHKTSLFTGDLGGLAAYAAAVVPTVMPEPGSLLLLAAGLPGLALLRHRRRAGPG